MKKKTALTLSTAALLSAGLLFGAKFYKQKKERDEFEEQLKTVLVPDAEKKLDGLLRKDAALNDSVIKFEEVLRLLKQKEDSVHAITESSTHDDIYEVGFLVGPFKEIYDLGRALEWQWSGKLHKIFYEFGDYEAERPGNWVGDGDYLQRTDKRAIDLFQKVFYMTGNESSGFPTVPAHNTKFILRDSLLASDGPTQDLSFFFDDMRVETTRLGGRTYRGFHNDERVGMNHSPEQKLFVLRAWQAFLKSIDNSQKVFNQKTLDALDKKVKELMPIVEKEYQLWSQRIEKGKKLESFMGAKDAVGKQIKQQKEKVNVLKTTPVVDLMRQQRGK